MPTVEIVVVIGAIVSGLVTIIGAVFAGLAAFRAGKIHHEVRTLNAKTIGEQIDATTSARYVRIPVADRTDEQVRHLLDVPPEGNPVRAESVEGNPAPPTVPAGRDPQ